MDTPVRADWFGIMGTSENSFLLRTAAIFSGGVVRPKFVLDVALATPAAILPLGLCRKKFRSFS
jgi:hypothetical protein